MKDRTGYLYFIRSEEQRAIKVGFTVDMVTRLQDLRSGNPSQIEIDAFVPAEPAAEAEFHRIMKPHRIRREWYPSDNLMDGLAEHLLSEWARRTEAKIGGYLGYPSDETLQENPAGVYFDAAEMRINIRAFMVDFFAPDQGIDVEMPTNHWTGPLALAISWASKRKGSLTKGVPRP